ncbi:tetratricopeptide repeat protein [Pseudoalteromonas agarivorans]|uniref:tetratricopeptide repeat protein n=1 Tax=Pseudoalteromonas agarivorans TaxID=176102 RepID=UPI00249AC1C5|nr:tetratricopeptide repeat protein [Pseudoalteromonas agarivorans]MDI3244595.1 tetratricopeptide repeat protein [Pseudoalteromonas agarivorans]
MGTDLMKGNVSNLKGHFEDWAAVKLHDQQLIKAGLDWQFYDQKPLYSDKNFLEDYIKSRFEERECWGVKDPRACLFLNEWQQSLGEQGSFLLVIRHWSSCIESLLHRHSRDIAYSFPNLSTDNVGFKFWLDPSLAAKMWLSYNKRLLSFAKLHPEKTILTTQRALFNGAPIINTVNEKFGFNLNENIDSPFDNDLFRDKASDRIFSSLSVSLKSQLNKVWQELLELATFRVDDEAPIIDNHQFIDESSVKDILLKVEHSHLTKKETPNIYNENSWFTKFDLLNEPASAIEYLDKSPATDSAVNDLKWLKVIDTRFSLSGGVHLSAAKFLMRAKSYSSAIEYFQKAITLGCYFPYVDMHVGQCWQAIGELNKAEFFFNKAINSNPNNPVFYTEYAKLLLLLNRLNDAEQQFHIGYVKGKQQPICVIEYCNYLESQGKLAEAVNAAKLFHQEAGSVASNNLLTRLSLKVAINESISSYFSVVKEIVNDRNKYDWIIAAVQLIDGSYAEKDFIIRCLQHWGKLNK